MNPPTGASRRLPLIGLGLSWTAALLLAASLVGLWLLLADRWPWAFFLLAAPLALLAITALYRQHSRVRSRRRLLAALDAYAQRQIAQTRRRTARPTARVPFTRVASGRTPLPSA